jgi:hypothetical protein
MKHGRGIQGLDDKSSGMEILMSDTFTEINPTDPLILLHCLLWIEKERSIILAKQAAVEEVSLFGTRIKKGEDRGCKSVCLIEVVYYESRVKDKTYIW